MKRLNEKWCCQEMTIEQGMWWRKRSFQLKVTTFNVKVRYDEKWPHETSAHIDEDTIDVKETMTTRKKVFWNHFSTMVLPPPRPTTPRTMMTKKMVNSFIKRQFVLSLAIIWVFMLQGTTEEAAIVSKVPR